MLKIPVKASQITNLTDARYFAARGVEWLGFSLDAGTESAIPIQQLSAIKEWVEGPKIVGAFGLQSPEEIKQVVDYLKLDIVQVSMFADTEAIHQMLELPIFKEIIIENEELDGLEDFIQQQASWVDHFVLDLSKNNIAWDDISADTQAKLQSLCAQHKILLHVNISLEGLPDLIEQTQAAGLILQGGEEEKVGYKSYDELDDILDFLEIEE